MGISVLEVSGMAVRLNRTQRREQTRAELLSTARREFLRRGFHQASVEEIAEAAGYSKGAVYSNFAGKDELFLAVLDDNTDRRRSEQVEVMLAAGSLEAAVRAAAGETAGLAGQDPQWAPLLVEFWSHAARSESLRRAVAERHELLLDGYGEILAKLAAEDGLEFAVPPIEVARSLNALFRGLTLERVVTPDAVPAESFEQLAAAHVMGMSRPRNEHRDEHEHGGRSTRTGREPDDAAELERRSTRRPSA